MKEIQKNKSNILPFTVKINFVLIMAIGFVWIVFGVLMAIAPFLSFARLGIYRWIIAALTFVAGLICIILSVLLRKRWKPAWFLSVIALSLMTIANIFDQIGWVDVLVLLGSAVPLVFLIKDRKWYLKA